MISWIKALIFTFIFLFFMAWLLISARRNIPGKKKK